MRNCAKIRERAGCRDAAGRVFAESMDAVVNEIGQSSAKREQVTSLQDTTDQTLSCYRIVDPLYAIDRGEIVFHGKPEEEMANAEVTRTLRG